MPYTPVSCGTSHSFRGTRSMPHTHWASVCESEWESTSIERERLLELCSEQQQAEMHSDSEAERENEGIRGRPKADHRAQ